MTAADYITDEASGDGWKIILGDSCERMAEIPDDTIGLSVYSPPFASLFTYSPSERDLGNSTTHAIGDFQYVYDPQGADGAADNAAKEMLVPGEEFYAIYRYGPPGEDALEVGDKVNIWHVQVGPQNRGATGDGEFDHLTITQTAIGKTPPVEDVALVA